MNNKDQLEEYIKYGVSGVPVLKREEKKKFLGEFKERVILAIENQYLKNNECFEKIEEVIQKKSVNKIIVNSSLNSQLRGKCMKLAKQYHKDFKLINGETTMAIILASNTAQEVEEIYFIGEDKG